jgi:hypothetical protein
MNGHGHRHDPSPRVELIYLLGLSFLLTHELDAVLHGEWRLLYGLRNLSDATAAPLFIALHLPLILALLWFGQHVRRRLRETVRLGVAGFLVIHTALHLGLAGSPDYGFHGLLSELLIYAAGLFGLLYLLIRFRARRR